MIQPGNAHTPKDLEAFEGYVCPGGLSADYLEFESVPGKKPAYVFVSGSGGNPWGHCLFRIHPDIGFVHAAQPGNHPTLYLPSEGWDQYALECQKTVWEVKEIDFMADRVDAVRILVNEYMQNGFTWVPWHDCVTMVDRIATAGGSDYVANTCFPNKAVAAIRKENEPPQAKKGFSLFGKGKGYERL